MNEEITTIKNIHVHYSEMDFDKSLKPFSLLNFFQDIATDNAERLGFGYSAIFPKNLMWVLLKYRIEFEEYPIDVANLTLKTQPRGYHRLFAYRNFQLFNQDKLVARASSMWSLVNFNDMSLVAIDSAIQSPYLTKFEKTEDDLAFGKIPALTQADFKKEFEVRYNDIDVNHHANNGNYIIWALEPLDCTFRTHHKLKTVDMFFKKEVKLGEKLVSIVQMTDEKTSVHVLRHAETQEDLCLLCCEWN
ncbi:MAG: hypothetical protein J6W96_02275 [Alphaproteobacteria bacterium]|nr:hypothetical protein [Alphaproteobacteria bacterium]